MIINNYWWLLIIIINNYLMITLLQYVNVVYIYGGPGSLFFAKIFRKLILLV